MGQRPVQGLGPTAAGGRVAWTDRGRVRAVRAVRDDGSRGPVLRGHRPVAVSRDGKRGQLRGGRGGHVVPVRGCWRLVGDQPALRRSRRLPVRVPRGLRRPPVRRAVCRRVQHLREDMHRGAPEQRAGPSQRFRA